MHVLYKIDSVKLQKHCKHAFMTTFAQWLSSRIKVNWTHGFQILKLHLSTWDIRNKFICYFRQSKTKTNTIPLKFEIALKVHLELKGVYLTQFGTLLLYGTRNNVTIHSGHRFMRSFHIFHHQFLYKLYPSWSGLFSILVILNEQNFS